MVSGSGEVQVSDDPYRELAEQRCRHEKAKAIKTEMENRVRAGDLLERHDVEVASSRMHAAIAQFLRSLPDDLERKFALEPAVVEALEMAIDSATVELGERIRDVLKG